MLPIILITFIFRFQKQDCFEHPDIVKDFSEHLDIKQAPKGMTRNSHMWRTSWMKICSSLQRDLSLSATMTTVSGSFEQTYNQGSSELYWGIMGYFVDFFCRYWWAGYNREGKRCKIVRDPQRTTTAAAEEDPCRERSLEDQVQVLPWQKPAVSKQQCMTQNLSGGVEQTQGLRLVCPKWKDIAGGWGRGNLRRKRADSDQRLWRPETSLRITVLILKTSLIKYLFM